MIVFFVFVVVFFGGWGIFNFCKVCLNKLWFFVWFKFLIVVLRILMFCFVSGLVKLIVVCLLNWMIMLIGFFKLIIFMMFFKVNGLKYNLLEIEKFVEIVLGLLFIIIVL